MASPMSAGGFLSCLKAAGVPVLEVGDWQTHNRNHKGPWGPVHGVMIHHTVTKGSAATVELCREGRPDLPGPLCHGVITKDGRLHLVGYGRANHAGLGDDDVLRAVIAEKALPHDNEADTDGNRLLRLRVREPRRRPRPVARRPVGDDREGLRGDLPPPRLVGAVGDRASGWQPGKVDPRGFTMNWLRDRIHDRLK